ncbi:MAG: hypothetical protein ABIS84_07265 [Arachnia sp.]
MPHDETRVDPLTKQVPLLWILLYVTCLMFGIVLAALMMPLQEGVVIVARIGFSIMMVLVLVILGLSTWRLTTALTVPRAAWRWVVVLVAVAAVVGVGVWSAAAHTPDESVLSKLGTAFLGALGFTLASAVGMQSLVKILASFTDGPRSHQTPQGR